MLNIRMVIANGKKDKQRDLPARPGMARTRTVRPPLRRGPFGHMRRERPHRFRRVIYSHSLCLKMTYRTIAKITIMTAEAMAPAVVPAPGKGTF